MAALERVDRASTPGNNDSVLPSHLNHAGRKKLEAAGVDSHSVSVQVHKNGSSLVE